MIYAELTMPNVGSWNGRWSQEKEMHIKPLSQAYKDLVGKTFHYNFGDGWCACVSFYEIDGTSRAWRTMKKNNRGFMGYDWMISSIRAVGRIERI